MNPYTRYVLPWAIDVSCGVPPFQELRSRIIPRASGRVLEVGVGTGHNLAHYDQARVSELIVLDPSEQMHARARRRAEAAGLDVRLLGLPAERIPLESNEIDTVVMTFTLCSVADPTAVVAELARVLRPEGELIFAEHGRAPEERVRRWQRRITPVQRRVAGGCELDRDIPDLIGAEFAIGRLEERYLPGPKIQAYVYSGVATPTAVTRGL